MHGNCQRDCLRSLLLTLTLFVCLAVDPFGFTSFLPIKASLFLLGGAMCLFLVLFTAPRIFHDGGARNFAIIAALLPLASTISWFFAVDTERFRETAPVWPQHPFLAWAGSAVAVGMVSAWKSLSDFVVWVRIALLLTLIVSLWAWLQRFGVVTGDFPGSWIGSFAGGPIYLGGTLLFLLPIAVWQLHEQWKKRDNERPLNWFVSASVVFFGVGAFFIAEKRGPMLGLGVGACAALIILGTLHKKQKLLRLSAAVGLASVLALTGLALLQKSGLPLRQIPIVGRLAMIVPMGENTGDNVRSSLWQAASTLGNPADPVILPDSSEDPLAVCRPWIGYGPDTVEAVIPIRWVNLPLWPKYFVEKTTHSHFWDTKIGMGYLGVVGLFVLVGYVLWRGLVGLGLVNATRREVLAYWTCCVGSVGLGAIVLSWIYGTGFAGLGAQFGLVGGFLLFTITRKPDNPEATNSEPGRFLLIAMMVGLIGHWVDMGFISQTGVTGPLFWLFLGGSMFLSMAAGKEAYPVENISAPRFDQWPGWPFLISLLVFASILHPTSLVLGDPVFSGQLWQWILIYLLVVIPASFYIKQLGSLQPHGFRCVTAIFLPGLLAPCFLAGLIMLIRGDFMDSAGGEGIELVRAIRVWSWFWPIVFVFTMATMLWWVTKSSAINREGRKIKTELAMASWLFFVWFGCSYWLAVPWLRGEIAHGIGTRLSAPKLQKMVLMEALESRPANYRVRIALANLADRAPVETSTEDLLEQGLEFSQFNFLSLSLGQELLRKSLKEQGGERGQILARKSLERFIHAGRTIPQNETAWFMASLVAEHLIADTQLAEHLKARADAATEQLRYPNLPVNTLAWADLHLSKSISWQKSVLEDPLLDRALHYYLRAWEESMAAMEGKTWDENAAKFWNPRLFWILTGKGHTLRRLGRYSEAAEAYRRAADIPWEERPFDPLPLAVAAEAGIWKSDNQDGH